MQQILKQQILRLDKEQLIIEKEINRFNSFLLFPIIVVHFLATAEK